MSDKFEAVMSGMVAAGGPGAAVGVRQGDAAPYLAGFGLADVEWGAPIGPDTVFRIGSITKQFTAAAIMLLVEDGKLSLDDEVRSVLPDYPAQDRRVTIRRLLNHTSGIKNFTDLPTFPGLMRTDMALSEVIGIFKDLPPDFAPGERYTYSNSGYVLLGAVIEAVSGMAYGAFLKERFFQPLGMERTRYLRDEPIVPNRARGYSAGRRGVRNARTMSMSIPHAAGALGSTVGDLLTWRRALAGGRAVSAASYAAMIEPARFNDGSLNEYGLGLLGLTYRDRPAITHAGGISGFVTIMTHFPDDDLTVVVLSNIETFPVELAHLALARRALDLPELAARPRVPLGPEALARCAGPYRFDAATWPITAEDGALIVPFPTPNSRFEPVGESEFQFVGDPEIVLRFDQPGETGFERLTIEGPMRRPLRPIVGRRAEP